MLMKFVKIKSVMIPNVNSDIQKFVYGFKIFKDVNVKWVLTGMKERETLEKTLKYLTIR